MDSTGKLYTPVEVAAILQISTRTVTRWLRDGSLKGIKTGPRLWRIPSSELIRITGAGTIPPCDVDAWEIAEGLEHDLRIAWKEHKIITEADYRHYGPIGKGNMLELAARLRAEGGRQKESLAAFLEQADKDLREEPTHRTPEEAENLFDELIAQSEEPTTPKSSGSFPADNRGGRANRTDTPREV